MVRKLSTVEKQAMVDEWQQQVKELLDQVEGWAQEQGWQVVRSDSTIQEDGMPPYSTQALEITVDGENRVHLQPIARFTLNGKGAAELRAWPAARRVRLHPSEKPDGALSWTVMTDSGIPLRAPWDRENFIILVQDLVARF